MPRVLVYAPRVLPRSQTFIADQVRALRRWTPQLVGRERVDNGLPIDDLTPPSTGVWRPARLHPITRRVPHLQRVVGAFDPDLIHAHFLSGGLDVVASLAAAPCPVIVTAHGFDATWHGSILRTRRPSQLLFGYQRHRLLRRPLRLIAVSQFIRQQLIDLGAPPEHIRVHYTGVDTSYFRRAGGAGGEPSVLFVGRLVAKKGAADLLMAMAVLRHEGTPAPITVIGDGPERPRLERLARAERLQVSFRGAQDRDEVRRAMQDASVFCVPSRADENGDREGLGMVFAEAQAMGLPVVSTTSGGIPEVVQHDETGLLVPEKRPDLLARALRRCLEDAELRERFGIAGRHRAVELFDLMEQTARLERLYDEWSTPRHDGPTGVTGWS